MLILFGRELGPITIKTDGLARRCEFADFVCAYVERRMTPESCEEFEQHMMDCAGCQRAVHLGRIRTRSIPHNRNDGVCAVAVKNRRKP
jgi:hypothetical protein